MKPSAFLFHLSPLISSRNSGRFEFSLCERSHVARSRLTLAACALSALGSLFAPDATAQSSRQDPVAFFETKIRPVLAEHCYSCHSATATNLRGGLLLDTREGIRRGGDTGPAVVPGDLERSLLIESIRYADPDTAMPPERHGGKLPDSVIADFEAWVRMGAPDPREGTVAAPAPAKVYDAEAAKKWWSFQPLRPSVVPEVANASWPRGEIDRFVLARLEAEGLKPVGDADKLALLRRVSFDLTGLPPSPELARRFLADSSPQAYEQLVDSLLASPRFGERWGRHWLDVARYAESTGKDLNVAFPHAWRYRDYVIAAFNADKPYDQFIREQLAGDLLPTEDAATRAERLIATGFLAVGPKGLGELTPRQYELDLADELIDATSQAFLGLTVSCARSHDHKFDPVTQRDYYAMAGIFLSTEVLYGTLSGPKSNQERELLALPKDADLPAAVPAIDLDERARIAAEYAEAKARYEDLMAQRSGPGSMGGTGGMGGMESRGSKGSKGGAGSAKGGGRGPEFFIQVQIALGRMAELEARLNAFDEEGHANPFAMAVRDRPAGQGRPEPMQPTRVVEIKGSSGIRPPSGFETIADSPLFARGEMNEPGERVPRGFPAFLVRSPAPVIPADASGRRELADWIADPHHPLTARVMANRIWHWLFGAGIVASVDNFGTEGTPPTHPELLDHLAVRLVRNQWSMKATIREIVLSRTYQLASTHDPNSYAADPENTLLWRHSKRRLDAEALRDAMLAASGQLDLAPPTGSLVALAGDGPIGSSGGFVRINEDSFIDATSYHRSVYLPIARDLLPDALAVFDYADAILVMGAREQTNVPAQALYLLNNAFVHELAEKFAERLAAKTGSATDPAHRPGLRPSIRLPAEPEGNAARPHLPRPRARQRHPSRAGLGDLQPRPVRQCRVPFLGIAGRRARIAT